MKKYILVFVLLLSSLQAGLIDAIAMTVNDTPITLYDIDKKMQSLQIDKQKAVSILVDEVLYKQLLDKYSIDVDIFDIDNYIEKLAKSNNMSLYQFKSAIRQQQDYTQFQAQIKKQLIHQKLISRIASNKIKKATNDDLKIYYDNNKDKFIVANKIDLIKYSSRDKKALEAIKQNPMASNNNIKVENLTVTQKDINSQMKYIVNKTKDGTFSAIFAGDKTYNLLFVSKKYDLVTIPFIDVKDKIFRIVMDQREKEYLNNYFETLKITADIKVLR
jgi:hypothetical protein